MYAYKYKQKAPAVCKRNKENRHCNHDNPLHSTHVKWERKENAADVDGAPRQSGAETAQRRTVIRWPLRC